MDSLALALPRAKQTSLPVKCTVSGSFYIWLLSELTTALRQLSGLNRLPAKYNTHLSRPVA